MAKSEADGVHCCVEGLSSTGGIFSCCARVASVQQGKASKITIVAAPIMKEATQRGLEWEEVVKLLMAVCLILA
eukprot:CAMPEP_0180749212 /NCGR_PEP_ID=MMETSP1038_2-20121128/30459_1 /TAXON_ID=632150 /ORGANISM="Azadinium spinosum, Strain 3D9" /LENGTH=73 /DNA_ID=CAMNT_0022782877 /DNA_START=250 /DNA_END=471 /DNA_ORIENTATION=-